MRAHHHMLRLSALLLATTLTVTACKGPRAQRTLNKTQEQIAIMTDLDAERHAGQRFEDLRNKVSQANQRLQAGDTNQALQLAREAELQANELRTSVEAAAALDLWNRAEADITMFETNALDRLDSDRYNRIIDIRREANAARDENNFRALIRLSREISQEVESGVAVIRNEAENARIQAVNQLTRLRSEGGQEYDPESVIDTQSLIDAAVRRIEQDRDFLSARQQFRAALARADQGLEAVEREKGKEAIQEIEEHIRVARDEGAQELNPDEYETVFRSLERVVENYNNEQYGRALDGALDLRSRADTMKINTKRLAADRRLRIMRDDINQLVDGGAREYLPGRVEELDLLLAEAASIREQNNEPAFDRVRRLYEQHEDQVANIDREFSALAQDSIRLAANELAAARSVYERMTEIFEPIEGDIPASMTSFEAGKQARAVQLGQEIESAQGQLESAAERVQDRQYRQAILIAQDQSQAANNVLNEIYRTVAGNAAIELSILISRYERDGARIYAEEELARSVADLNRVKESFNEGDFVDSVEAAGAARSNVELMARRISGRAVEDIREARNVYDRVSSDRTRRHASQQLARVERLIDQAETALQEERLKQAVELANEAIRTANEANNLANRRAAEETIDEAREKLARAQSAGAALYAGRDVESARRLFESAQALLRAGDAEKAYEQAEAAVARANQAFYKQVDDAESSIADAKAVGGWEHDNSNLSRAVADAREARELLESADYQRASSLAVNAQSRAESVARASRRNNFNQAVRRIRRNLDEGRQQGVNLFQVGDAIEIRQRLAELENEWSLDRYDFIMDELTMLEGNLRGTLDTTDEVVSTVSEQQQQRLERLVELGANDFATSLVSRSRDSLRFARIDYRNGQFKSAHTNLSNAIRDINEIERRYRQESYVRQLESIFSDYQDAQFGFRTILSMDPTELKALAFDTMGRRGTMVSIASPMTPAEFRRDVERVYSQAILLEPPAELSTVHQSVVEAINNGRIAAIHFEKLIILNETSTSEAERLINAAYASINLSNRQISDIQRQFFSDEIRVRLVSEARTR